MYVIYKNLKIFYISEKDHKFFTSEIELLAPILLIGLKSLTLQGCRTRKQIFLKRVKY